MPLFGSHMSVAGGLHKAVERIARVQGQSLQIFTRNQRQWNAAPVSPEEARAFAQAWQEWGDFPVVTHGSYLVNLASPDAAVAAKSARAFMDELVRTEALGISFVVTHPGACVGTGRDEGIARAAAMLRRCVRESGTGKVSVLLENTAGQGTTLGSDFAELGVLLDESGLAEEGRAGVCLDTAHAFAAGYDLRTAAGYNAALAALDRHVGLEKLHCVHVNDSLAALGSRVDRHAHIGEGHLGADAFALLVRDPRLAHLPMVLETPKDETLEDDRRNLALLRRLAKEESVSSGSGAGQA
ncbi:deoxyribonuclease IV [Desulfovibrio psychrotolerans]|uniref:Probable endonuclease 4 n=1 Tax=Desulfovibrio psychrotolerans TaxID=415242 RepID=A0A7J0BX46_9BACT|nr:deoxyribonuclease IV [Desulfovibrio psychrotolerans]GFM38263.1 putative endonuclease 4 [Desulfovibrio psychrotolerans]